jgi:hypothetical protein
LKEHSKDLTYLLDAYYLFCPRLTMKTAVFASLIAGAAAFAPAKTAQSSTALAAAFGEEVRAWDASKPGLDFDVPIVSMSTPRGGDTL